MRPLIDYAYVAVVGAGWVALMWWLWRRVVRDGCLACLGAGWLDVDPEHRGTTPAQVRCPVCSGTGSQPRT